MLWLHWSSNNGWPQGLRRFPPQKGKPAVIFPHWNRVSHQRSTCLLEAQGKWWNNEKMKNKTRQEVEEYLFISAFGWCWDEQSKWLMFYLWIVCLLDLVVVIRFRSNIIYRVHILTLSNHALKIYGLHIFVISIKNIVYTFCYSRWIKDIMENLKIK